MQTSAEAELIALTLGGNHEAYAELIDRYKNAVYYHCFAIVRDEDAAEDLAQETFVLAYYNLKKFNNNYRLATWLFKISTNKCLNHLKKRAREFTADDKLLGSLVSPHKSPHVQSVDDELHRAVEALRPKYRTVISLYYWQGLDYAETAQAMGAPVNSIRVWLSRAKAELRKELV